MKLTGQKSANYLPWGASISMLEVLLVRYASNLSNDILFEGGGVQQPFAEVCHMISMWSRRNAGPVIVALNAG